MLKDFASKVYGFFVNKNNEKFDKSEPNFRARVPVISVGNLSVGGTGKTPFVQMLGKYFKNKNVKIGIIGRGYKRDSSGEVLISDGNKIFVDANEGGDEMVLLAQSLKVPVIAHDKKYLAAKSMQEKFDVDIILLDDGYQHRHLHRDIDILLLDKETIATPDLLPKGRLREPLSSLERADVICLTGKFDLSDEAKKYLRKETVLIKVEPVNAKPYLLGSNETLGFRQNIKIHNSILPFAGIAKPNRFFDMLKSMNYSFDLTHQFDDHHRYKEADIKLLIKKAEENNILNLATTEKDAVKLIEYIDLISSSGINCYVFPIALSINYGRNNFFNLLNALIKKSS